MASKYITVNPYELSQLLRPVAIHAGHTALPGKTGFLIICSFSTEDMVISTLDIILILMNSTASVLPLCIILWAIGKCSGTLRMYNREACSSWGWGGVAFSFLYVGSLVMHPGFQNTCRFLLNPCSFQTPCWSVRFSHRSRKKDDEARKYQHSSLGDAGKSLEPHDVSVGSSSFPWRGIPRTSMFYARKWSQRLYQCCLVLSSVPLLQNGDNKHLCLTDIVVRIPEITRQKCLASASFLQYLRDNH